MINYSASAEVVAANTEKQDEFVKQCSRRVCHVGYWNNRGTESNSNRLFRYAQSYCEFAHDNLVRFVNSDGAYADDDALPLLWACSHSFELMLKCAILHQLEANFSESSLPKCMTEHSLNPLFEKLTELCPGSQLITPGMGKFVRNLDRLNSFNQNRYPLDTKYQNPTWQDQCLVPMGLVEIEFRHYANSLYVLLTDDS